MRYICSGPMELCIHVLKLLITCGYPILCMTLLRGLVLEASIKVVVLVRPVEIPLRNCSVYR